MTTQFYADLFHPRPEQMSLRGDGVLWDELSNRLGSVALPNSSSEVKQTIQTAIIALTGINLDEEAPQYVAQFDVGGLSGGQVSAYFWKNTAIPLLLSRFRGKAPATRDYFAELYVAGMFGDAGWAVYFPKRDIGFDFVISKEVDGAVVLRPVQVKGRYPTTEKKDKVAYGFVGTLTAMHRDMVLAMPFFAAGERGAAPHCVAFMPAEELKKHASGAVRCEPCQLQGGVPKPRPTYAKYFGWDGMAALEHTS